MVHCSTRQLILWGVSLTRKGEGNLSYGFHCKGDISNFVVLLMDYWTRRCSSGNMIRLKKLLSVIYDPTLYVFVRGASP